VARYSNINPSIFAFGSNKGFLKICDLRTSSDCLSTSQTLFDENNGLSKTVFAKSVMSIHDLNFNIMNSNMITTRQYLSLNYWDIRNTSVPCNKIILYEPIISKMSYLYQYNYIQDKFSLNSDCTGRLMITGGYNNMFHLIDAEQRLNTQITIDDNNDKIMNTNVIRKINSKGGCFYKKDDVSLNSINFDKKILKHAYSPVENFVNLILLNCIYSYVGINKKLVK
jgi:serine/threonine-protein phosphatase 2A regulatory subunit B